MIFGPLTVLATFALVLLAFASGVYWSLGGEVSLDYWRGLAVTLSVMVPLSAAAFWLDLS